MRIKGEVFKKRSYPYHAEENIDCICFLEIDDAIQVGEDKIKVIPILSEESIVSRIIGNFIEVEGEIYWKQIITPLGRPNSLPVPILRLDRIEKIHYPEVKEDLEIPLS